MSESAETLSLNGSSKFYIELNFHDAGMPNSTHTFKCVVDTGCPDAIALPETYGEQLSRFITTKDRGGAGQENSPTFGVVVTGIGGIELEHTTSCICSLRNKQSLGLIGIDLLKDMDLCMHDEPDEKLLDLLPNHFPDWNIP